MARDRVCGAVVAVLADARAEGDRAGEGDPAADGVHDGRSGEVVEAEPLEPACGALAREAAPHPVAAHGVDDGGDEDRVDEVALELDALGDGAGDDRRGGRGEHRLEEEEGPVPGAFALGEPRHPESAPAEGAAELRRAEHQRGAEDVERERAGGEVHQVLHHDVRRVLRAGEAGLDEREAGLHHEDEDGGDERPDDVQVGLDEFGGHERLGGWVVRWLGG